MPASRADGWHGPETFSRVLGHLRERVVILQNGARLQLTDPDGLQQIAAA